MWEQLHWYWSTQEWTRVYCPCLFSSCISVFSCRCRFCIAFSDFLVSGLLVASFLETLVGLVTNVPFVFGKASPNNEKDAWSFLSTSEGWPCGHWELSSGATGVDEKSPLRLSHGRSLHDTLLTHVHSWRICRQIWWHDDATQWVCSGRSIEYFLRNSFR